MSFIACPICIIVEFWVNESYTFVVVSVAKWRIISDENNTFFVVELDSTSKSGQYLFLRLGKVNTYGNVTMYVGILLIGQLWYVQWPHVPALSRLVAL